MLSSSSLLLLFLSSSLLSSLFSSLLSRLRLSLYISLSSLLLSPPLFSFLFSLVSFCLVPLSLSRPCAYLLFSSLLDSGGELSLLGPHGAVLGRLGAV